MVPIVPVLKLHYSTTKALPPSFLKLFHTVLQLASNLCLAAMLPQHVFSHQHQYPHTDPSWQLQQQQNHHQHQPHHGTQHNAQAQAAAAAAAAQQQHYNRIANNNSAGAQSMGGEHNSGFIAPDQGMSAEERRILEWIVQLMNPNTRESALLELSKKREQFPQLALILWHSFGTLLFSPIAVMELTANPGVMTSLLQEIISVYPLLNPSQLTAAASNRVCNALALLQCVASHSETRSLFLSGMSKA